MQNRIIFYFSKYLNRRSFLLYTDKPLSFTNVNNSPVLSELVFTNYTSNFFGYENHTLHCMKETQEHCKLRHRNQKKKTPFSPPHSPTKVCCSYLYVTVNP